MKHRFFFIALLPMLCFLIYACQNNSNSKASSADSSSAKRDTSSKIWAPEIILGHPEHNTINAKLADAPTSIISNGSESDNSTTYRGNPLKDPQGNAVYGFMLDKGDFQNLIALPKINNIYLEFGVNHLNQLTIMVVPVDATGAKIPVLAGYSAYDFVCPCPSNASCCPH